VRVATLFTEHLLSLQTAYSDLKRQAVEQPFVLVGTPGSVDVRDVNGRSFFYRQYYDPQGKKVADYLGSVEDDAGKARSAAVREQIDVANGLLEVARVLGRSGYMRADARTDAVLAALANGGVFRAGGLLIGSHSYGAMLNDLGVRAAAYATQDVDVARARPLELPTKMAFEEMLEKSRVPLIPIPQLERKKPSTSWSVRGRERFRVDLLAPTQSRLPGLRYLLEEPLPSIVIGRSAVVPVNVPRPERLAWHKMLVTELRHETSEKKSKDVEQAAVLVAVLVEREPDAITRAFREVPASRLAKTKRGAARVIQRLEKTKHERAIEFMKDLLG